MSWVVIERGNGEIHVLPKDDKEPHRCDQHCPCGPWLDDGIWIHHAADGREGRGQTKH